MTNQFKESHVKILVHTKSEDGYPPEEWEGIWATPMGDSLFKIDNIPFYAKGLSCDDIVEAAIDAGEYRLIRVVSPSDNSTIRVLVFDLHDEGEVRKNLLNLGCSIEGTGTPGLIALNVPKPCRDSVDRFLRAAFEKERLDFEEGALR